jgi:hypothetical protein
LVLAFNALAIAINQNSSRIIGPEDFAIAYIV